MHRPKGPCVICQLWGCCGVPPSGHWCFHQWPKRNPCLAHAIASIRQVEFPERAGALARFLSVVSPAFNVTLFHYRRTGAAPHPSA